MFLVQLCFSDEDEPKKPKLNSKNGNRSGNSVSVDKSVNRTVKKSVNQKANKSGSRAQNRTVNQTLSNKTLGGKTAKIVRNTPTSARIEGDTTALMGADLNSFSQTSTEMDSTAQTPTAARTLTVVDTLSAKKTNSPALVEKVSPEVVEDHTEDSTWRSMNVCNPRFGITRVLMVRST